MSASPSDIRSPRMEALARLPVAAVNRAAIERGRRYLLAKNRNAPVLLAALWPGRGMILATGLTSPKL